MKPNRKIGIFTILFLLVIFATFAIVNLRAVVAPPTSLNYGMADFVDVENDVYRFTSTLVWVQGDYIDAIDINNFSRSGQLIYVNFSASYSTTAQCEIYVDINDNDLWDYLIEWNGASNEIWLSNGSFYWSGGAFQMGVPTPIGLASGSLLDIAIPAGAYTVAVGDEYQVLSIDSDATYTYQDWSRDVTMQTTPSPPPPPIPGFELLFVLLPLIGLVYVFLRRRQLRK